MILKKLLKFLGDEKIKYEIVEHKTVYTALDSAETQHIKPQEIVKTLVMKIGPGKAVLALIPANKNLDKMKFKKAASGWAKKENLKIKPPEFAKEPWMKKNIQGKIGATPCFGSIFDFPVFVDRSLFRQKNLFVNSGDYNYSIKLSLKNFEKALGEIIRGSFAKKK
jgi:Ala-tRNA(Pro) deacylase